MDKNLAHLLVHWYKENARDLPWRETLDPYQILISEIMLQQTQVKTALPYFRRWINRFPTINSLANASEKEVLKLWEGLGYYSRARNLLKAAQIIVDQYSGEIPDDRKLLEKLPGIGKYTGGAIASIAFGKDEAILDGNIRRVFCRIFNIEVPIRTDNSERILYELANENLIKGNAGDYNQALMELGALICLPKNPKCGICPVSNLCIANKLNLQNERPVKNKKPVIPHYHVVAGVIVNLSGEVLISKRPESGLLGGMWEFPGGKIEPGEKPGEALTRELMEELGVFIQVNDYIGMFKHAYTHFKVTLQAFYCSITKNTPRPLEVSDFKWITINNLSEYPMGKLDRLISKRIQNDE